MVFSHQPVITNHQGGGMPLLGNVCGLDRGSGGGHGLRLLVNVNNNIQGLIKMQNRVDAQL